MSKEEVEDVMQRWDMEVVYLKLGTFISMRKADATFEAFIFAPIFICLGVSIFLPPTLSSVVWQLVLIPLFVWRFWRFVRCCELIQAARGKRVIIRMMGGGQYAAAAEKRHERS